MSSTFTILLRATAWLTLSGAACVHPRAPVPAAPPEIAQAIPPGARAVRIYSDLPPAGYYRTVYRALQDRGFEVYWYNENEPKRTLRTEFKEFSLTTLRLDLVVEAAPGGSVAILRGQWRDSDYSNTIENIALEAGGYGHLKRNHAATHDAIWKRRSRYAFGEMAVIANALPHTRVEYVMR
jgi:hypothetical protein